MKSRFILAFLLLPFFFACHNKDTSSEEKAENDVDAARIFIQAALNGDYAKARQMIVPDSLNNQFLDVAERNYQNRMSREDKRGYRESSIIVHDIRQLNDSTSIVKYSNSYKKQNDSLKVVRINGQWLIDLKYSFPAEDSTRKTK
jgi:Domain of unknown function (DUF4878)